MKKILTLLSWALDFLGWLPSFPGMASRVY